MVAPESAVRHYMRVQRLKAAAQLRARRTWALVDPAHIADSWAAILSASALVDDVSSAQVEAAVSASSYGASALADQGVYDAPDAFVDPSAFGGYAGSGVALKDALQGGSARALHLIKTGADTASALRQAGGLVEMRAGTAVSDAGRSAAGVDTFTRPRTGYVRMLNPPSCSRCAVLAGKFYRHNQGFLRHPRCDCTHIPTMENIAGDATTDPYAYFKSLDGDDQDRLFTKAGAQAIRDGGDIFQVVNSRRGMSANGTTTLAGTTRRAVWGGMNRGKVRLTPEGIYQMGLSRAETLSMLKRYGYILPGGQDPAGVLGGSVRVNYANTMTEAQKRVQAARLNWEAVQQGRHPQSGRTLTPAEAARYEDAYRKTLARGGEIYLPGE